MRYIIKNFLCTLLMMVIFTQSVTAKLSWTTSFGLKGDKEGEFDTPYGIKINKDGIIHVTDTKNNRIQRFKSDTTFLDKIGKFGENDKEFKYPTGLDIAKPGTDLVEEGVFYITDSGGNRIQRFDKNLVFINSFGQSDLQTPSAVAIDLHGNTIVADVGKKHVVLFNGYEELTDTVSAGGDYHGLTTNTYSDIYVSDGGQCNIYNKFEDHYELKSTIGEPGSGNGQFNNLGGIALTDDNNMYFADSGNNRIQYFVHGADGPYRGIYSYSLKTSEEGYTFSNPTDIAISNDGRAFVVDSNNDRVVVLFDRNLWKTPGTTTLGTLKLTSDMLTLDKDYRLNIEPMTDTSSGSSKASDGMVTLNKAEISIDDPDSLSAIQINIDKGSLSFGHDGEFNIPINIVNEASIFLDEDHTPTISGKISGAGLLVTRGKTISLTGANDYKGGTQIRLGTLKLGDNLSAGRGVIFMSHHTTLSAASKLELDNDFELTGDNTINTDSDNIDINGVINGGGILIKEGDFALSLNKGNNYHSGTKLNAGMIILGDNLASGKGAISMADGTFLGVAKSLEIENNISLTGNNIIDSSEHTFTLNGVIDGNGILKKYGDGTVLLKQANSYKGGTKISEGILSLGDNMAAGDGAISLESKATFAAEKDIQIANDINLPEDDYASIDTNGNTLTIKKITSGDEVGLYKTSSGKLIIDAMNYNYAGYTTIEEGTIQLLHYNSLGDGSITIENGGILQTGVDSLGIANSIGLRGTATIDTQQYSFIINEQISGDSGSLTKIGSGILFLQEYSF